MKTLDIAAQVDVYVRSFFSDDHYAKECVNSLLTKYDIEKVKYAAESNMDLFDLDRWEFAGNLHKDSKLKAMLSTIGFNFSDEDLDAYLSDGDEFFKKIVGPLWASDYEIIELDNYQNIESTKLEYKRKQEVYLERLYEGTTVGCESSVDDVVKAIIEEYQMYEAGIADILGSMVVHGLSVEDVVSVYARVYEIVENDKVIRIADGEEIVL